MSTAFNLHSDSYKEEGGGGGVTVYMGLHTYLL